MFEFIVHGGTSLQYSQRIDFGRLMTAGRRARQAMFFATLLSLAIYCSVVSCKIQEPTTVIQAEQMQIEAKHGKETSESIGMFLRNPRSVIDTTESHKITFPSDEEKTNEHGVQQPKEDGHHQGGIVDKEDFSTNKAKPEDMQPASVPMQMWKTLEFPSDHVLLFQCSGDELTVRILPRLDGFEEYYVRISSGHLSSVCANRLEMPSVYDASPHYRALFWLLPEEEDLVPVPPTELSETTLTEEETPESFTFSTDVVVVFYQSTTMEAKRKIHIMAREAVEFRPATGEKPGAILPFSPDSIVFWTNAPYAPHATYVAFS